MARGRLAPWPALALACALALRPQAAHAEAGVWDVGAQAAWISVPQAQLTAVAHLGLADAFAWHMEAGLRVNQAQLVRPEVATGVTWLYDVTHWVPAVTLGLGMVFPDARPALLGLGRLELRRFVTPHAWATALAGVEVTRAGWSGSVGVGFAWQLDQGSSR